MCVIILCEKESGFPPLATLESAEKLNAHGGGIAWVENGKVRYQKGINAKEIFEITKQIQLPAIIHFRIASIGAVNKELCHPFQISEDASTDIEGTCDGVLFHNGTWSEWNEYMMKAVIQTGSKIQGQWSDSRAMAWLTHKYDFEFLQLLDSSNKIAVLTKDGIRKFGRYVEVDKNLCSNDYFDNRFGGYSGLYKTTPTANSHFNRGSSLTISNDVEDDKPLSKRQRKKKRKQEKQELEKLEQDIAQKKLDIKNVASEVDEIVREAKKDGWISRIQKIDNDVDDEPIAFENETDYEQDRRIMLEDKKAINLQRMKEAQDEAQEEIKDLFPLGRKSRGNDLDYIA